MNILTREQKNQIVADAETAMQNDQNLSWRDALISQTEAAVLSKLVGQAGEHVGYLHVGGLFGNELEEWEFEAEQRVCDQINEESYGKSLSLKLYTEAQILAAQQRAAQACARYCAQTLSPSKPIPNDTSRAWIAGTIHCTDGIRNGEWREYL